MIRIFAQHLKKIKIRLIKKKSNHTPALNNYDNLKAKSLVEIYAALRHETHRLEKAVYNNLLDSKRFIYDEKQKKIKDIQKLILEINPNEYDNPVFQWSLNISESYPNLKEKFIKKYSSPGKKIDFERGNEIIELLKNRRSNRLWGEPLSKEEINQILNKIIQAAKWAPNSGNRQAVRFKPIFKKNEKEQLIGLKEQHCYNASLLIFVGVDSRLYGALSTFEECMYLDAAAAITQIIIYLETIGFGSSWNHLGQDMINSRPGNIEKYRVFAQNLKIPEYIIPIAIIAIGRPQLITPAPERMPDNYYLL